MDQTGEKGGRRETPRQSSWQAAAGHCTPALPAKRVWRSDCKQPPVWIFLRVEFEFESVDADMIAIFQGLRIHAGTIDVRPKFTVHILEVPAVNALA
jgi:hypothetical protein